MDEETVNSGLSVEELTQLLSNYFYTKEEQKENSSLSNEVSSSNFELVMSKLDILNTNVETTNTVLYLIGVGMLGVLLLFIYYRFLKQFIERWF